MIAREYGFASWPKLKQHVELVTNVAKRVEKLRADFAAGDRETRLRLLRPAHAAPRFENYAPDAVEISEADARLLVANEAPSAGPGFHGFSLRPPSQPEGVANS